MYTLVHNGYNVSYHKNMDEVNAKIDEVLGEYKDLTPKLTVDEKGKYKNHGKSVNMWVRAYTYYTLYMEMFMIIEGRV